jgi:amino acid transporter
MPVEETKGGQRTVYKSLKIVMGIVVIVYLLLNISLIGSLGSDALADSPAPLATAAGLISKDFESIIGLIGIIAMLSALNAYMIGTGRILQNISSLFDFRLLEDLASSGTPAFATIVASSSACVLLLFFSNHFEELANIAVASTLLPYIFVCISAYKIFHNKKTRFIASIGTVSTSIILAVYFSVFLV